MSLQGEDIPPASLPEIIPFLAKLHTADQTTALHIVTGICPSTREVPEPAWRVPVRHSSAHGYSSRMLLGLGLHPKHPEHP